VDNFKSFKDLISFLESSDNPEVEHKPVVKGVSKGDTAIGQYGLMPNTIRELANRAKLSDQNYPSDDVMLQSTNEQIKEVLKNNPDLMNLYVDRLSKRVLEKSSNNPEAGYFRWLYGHNLPEKRVKSLKRKDPETLQRIRKAIDEKHLMSRQPDLIQIPEEPYIDKPYSKMRKK